jgi:phage I-like protein
MENDSILFTLRGTELAEAPEVIQILPLGDHVAGKGGAFTVTLEDVDVLIEGFKKLVNDLAVDYEHLTFEKIKSPAAGWIKELINKDEGGLWARVEWTEVGKAHIQQKEYRYFSPTILAKKQADGSFHPVELLPGALTNFPAIDGMEPLTNKSDFKDEESMDEILKALGLTDSADPKEVVSAIETLKAESATFKAKSETLEVKEVIPVSICKALDLKESSDATEVEATIHVLKNSKAGDSEVLQIKNEMAEMKAEQRVEKAMEDGYVSASQKDWALDYAKTNMAGFEIYLSKATKIVPDGELPEDPDKKEGGELSDDGKRIASMFDNSEEDLKKYGGTLAQE